MNLIGSFGFCIFVSVLTIAQCQVIESMYGKHMEIDCQTALGAMAQTIRTSMCQVKDTLVDLKPTSGYRYVPPIASVKRCDGNCRTGLSCEPLETRITEVYVDVKLLYGRRWMKRCAVVRVEEHVSCRCKCEATEMDCNDRQMFDKNSCKCECKAERESKMKCEEQEGMRWDKDDCSCKCMLMPRECSTQGIWSEAHCTCMHEPTNRKYEHEDEKKNSTECQKQLGMWWDEDDGCKCMMLPMKCTIGRRWSKAHCKCVQ
ncbi:balbiani ring protein 3-like isoform X1 [Neodiprion pinetum]|uniref:balbiani ring protein 3-like isoform X1 n=1 Tax=Neodiprion pinetum TaxID=441929 RepID=UPI001EDD3F75|nr:balbiani ring protein 3-like [Neodiprion pinetum]